jgi:hypothetical protein
MGVSVPFCGDIEGVGFSNRFAQEVDERVLDARVLDARRGEQILQDASPADVMGAERLQRTPIIARMCGRRVAVRASERLGYNSCHR